MKPASKYSTFSSELRVRPDDIDMNNHVHNARYFDYVLAARYDQMERCYRVSMDEFIKLGYTWVVVSCYIEFKQPLGMGDTIIVNTGIDEVRATGVKVKFSIQKKESGLLCAEGNFEYALLNARSGKLTRIPAEIAEKYSI